MKNRTLGQSQIAAAFFLSGASALIYQIGWQRLLFVIIGVDIESITIIVSSFMLGLGLGAWLGGLLADRFPKQVLAIFCLFELLIGSYGCFSFDLLNASALAFSQLSRGDAAALSFCLLLLPTLCMGATLPMLVAHAVRQSASVGVATGSLYFINTLGAALGAVGMGFFLLYWLDLRQTIHIAAGINLLASLIVASTLIGKR